MKPVSEPALEDWRSTFTAEVTRGFLDAATRFARKRLRRLGLPCSADDARDLVLDVLHDTWPG